MNGSNDPLGVNMFLGMLNMLRVRPLALVVCGLTFSLHAVAEEGGHKTDDSALSTQLLPDPGPTAVAATANGVCGL